MLATIESEPEGEVMGLGFAVFNGHVNKADKRARCLMAKLFPVLLEEVEQIERDGDGIMAIFNQPMTNATQVYATLVCAYVNEDRIPERKPLTAAD